MTKFISRTFTLFLLLACSFSAIFYLIFGMTKPYWKAFIKETYWDLPIIFWAFFLCFFISFLLALFSFLRERAIYKKMQKQLDLLINRPLSVAEQKTLPKPLRNAFTNVNDMIHAQRKSLQRLTNDKATAQDALIQERIIQERQRLARELHDSVSQQLFAASMLLSATNETIAKQLPETNQKQLQQTEKIVQQAQLEMRALLLHLRPVALKNKTLAEGLHDLIEELRQKVYFNITETIEEVTLSKGAEDHVFRIAQETLSNTLRHAKATEVELLLIERQNLVIFRLQDNGVGFEKNDENYAGSYGLQNIEERAIEIGAKYKVVSIVGQGTIIEVQIPTEKEVHER